MKTYINRTAIMLGIWAVLLCGCSEDKEKVTPPKAPAPKAATKQHPLPPEPLQPPAFLPELRKTTGKINDLYIGAEMNLPDLR